MGSVSSSINPGVADLLQTLTKVNSPVLKSPAAVSALEKAPPADIVQLSEAASQLANINAMFGTSTSSSSAATNIDSLFGIPTSSTPGSNTILQALENQGATLTPAEQAAQDQAVAQTALTNGLFGIGANQAGTLFNTIG